MSRFYLNNYIIIDIFLVALSVFSGWWFLIHHDSQSSIDAILKVNGVVIGSSVSLTGFVFTAITLLIGLHGNNLKDEEEKKWLGIIARLSKGDDDNLTIDERIALKNNLTATRVFFGTAVYKRTLNVLSGCLTFLVISFFVSLFVEIFGSKTGEWAIAVLFSAVLIVLSIVRLLLILRSIIKVLTNKEQANK